MLIRGSRDTPLLAAHAAADQLEREDVGTCAGPKKTRWVRGSAGGNGTWCPEIAAATNNTTNNTNNTKTHKKHKKHKQHKKHKKTQKNTQNIKKTQNT